MPKVITLFAALAVLASCSCSTASTTAPVKPREYKLVNLGEIKITETKDEELKGLLTECGDYFVLANINRKKFVVFLFNGGEKDGGLSSTFEPQDKFIPKIKSERKFPYAVIKTDDYGRRIVDVELSLEEYQKSTCLGLRT